MSPPPPSKETTALFELSATGSIRHWLVAGPKETPYAGPAGPDHVLRREALDQALPRPPSAAVLGEPGPFGSPWRFHDPGRNEFVEFSTFYPRPAVVECYACTELAVPEAGIRKGRLWAAGAADLWLDGALLSRLRVTRSRNPDFRPVALPLKEGVNRLCVRLQCLGLRDTRMLFGLFLEESNGVAVVMARAARLAEAARWIGGVRARGRQELVSPVPAPLDARVIPCRAEPRCWPAGASAIRFEGAAPAALTIEIAVDGATLQHSLELPGNAAPAAPPPGDRRSAHLEYIAKAGTGSEPAPGWNAVALPLLARRLLGRTSDQDQAALAAALEAVDERRDCADFALAALLRLEMLRLGTSEESAAVRRAALAFRYGLDEPGNDGMCFTSENHSLLFHGCQLLAGRLYPRDVFSNSGRTGSEQADLARHRIRQWLDKIEARGFEEYNSSTYIPITVAAMLNVVDFSGDAGLSARMAAQIDGIFRNLARHAFGGGIISPQGRVYRDVLFPEEAGTQVLLAYATEAADVVLAGPRPPRARTGDWVVFLASSPGYRPPDDLAALVREPVSRVYRQGDAQILLEKTPAYILTSLAVPAPPREGEHPENDLRPGGAGYQQHLWQATLGPGCHVFVNHPGGFFDGTQSRPGYWHGSGILPRLRQKGNWLQAIHVIADGSQTRPEITPEIWEWAGPSTVRPFDLHPIPFTHAHWPSDAFDREERRGSWIFGQKGRGLVGLWCSEPLVPHDDVLTGRELRANGYASAWLVICGDAEKTGPLKAFMASCAAREPAFDRAALTLAMKDEEPTRWWERPEPMPY